MKALVYILITSSFVVSLPQDVHESAVGEPATEVQAIPETQNPQEDAAGEPSIDVQGTAESLNLQGSVIAEPTPQNGATVEQVTPEVRDTSPSTKAAILPAFINPYGPKFFGPGLNNPLAITPDPGLITVAKEILQSNPALRVRVLVNGDVEITDEFGIRKNVVDALGNNPLEPIDPEERLELELERRELELEQQFNEKRLRLRHQLLQQKNLQQQQPQQQGIELEQSSSSLINEPATPVKTGNSFFITK